MNTIKIKVDVISDVVCPWCYIGKRRLEKAIAALPPQYEVDLTFFPFELNPDQVQEGSNQKEYLQQKFGGTDRFEELTAHVSNVALEEGLIFNFDKQEVMPNTLDAHRLIQMAQSEGVQPAVKEALMKAYFTDGVDLSKKENLVKVVAAAGLDQQKATDLLASDEGIAEIQQLEKIRQQQGIRGVPFYIINGKYGVSGAQPADAFVQALTQIGEESQASGESCEVGEKC